MRAFHNKKTIKTKYLNRVIAHQKAGEIAKGNYYYKIKESGKWQMCAIGSTIHGNSHQEYEIQLGIPQMLARLEDTIFERLPNKEAMSWPEQFLEAVPVGADLSKVGWLFLQWLLLNAPMKNKEVKAALKECADFLTPLTKGKKIDTKKAYTLRYKMWILGAKYYPVSAAYAVALDAVDTIAINVSVIATHAPAKGKFYIKMSKKLLELIKEAK